MSAITPKPLVDHLCGLQPAGWMVSRWRVGAPSAEPWSRGVVCVAAYAPDGDVWVSLGGGEWTLERALWVGRIASEFGGTTEVLSDGKLVAHLPRGQFESESIELRRALWWRRVARATVAREGDALDKFGVALWTHARRVGFGACERVAQRVSEALGGDALPRKLPQPPTYVYSSVIIRKT